MSRSTNPQVIQSFLKGHEASAGALSTSGNKLYSYNLLIAEWASQHTGIIVYDYTATGQAFRSMTTSQHVGLIKREVGNENIMLPEVAKIAGLIK
jgi:hypothetical protein